MLKLKLQYIGHLGEEVTHFKRPCCWERLKAKQEGEAQNEMVGWCHLFNGHELGQTPGDVEEQEGLACCSPWGHKELDTIE